MYWRRETPERICINECVLEEDGDARERFYYELNKECVLKEVDAREDLHQHLIRMCAGGRGRRQRGLTSICNESRMCAGGGWRRQRGFTYIFDSRLIRNMCWRGIEMPERIYINI